MMPSLVVTSDIDPVDVTPVDVTDPADLGAFTAPPSQQGVPAQQAGITNAGIVIDVSSGKEFFRIQFADGSAEDYDPNVTLETLIRDPSTPRGRKTAIASYVLPGGPPAE
jgi:hypothetical protein